MATDQISGKQLVFLHMYLLAVVEVERDEGGALVVQKVSLQDGERTVECRHPVILEQVNNEFVDAIWAKDLEKEKGHDLR